MTLGLFQGYGVELEYMVVERGSLRVLPVVDELLLQVSGSHEQEVVRGDVAWSNELALHVVELKTNGPARSLAPLSTLFHNDVAEINRLLEPMNGQLMPTAMHPFMVPAREMRLWPHGDREIYNAYHRIFDCQGHGWSNLQSTHLNLPFSDDDEFKRLHAAIRFVMPLLPGLWASSPVVEGRLTALDDNRLHFYRHNQRRVPALTGQVVPEAVYSRAGYQELLRSLYQAVKPFDPDGILQFEWLNSRGAIARFDRMAVELRTLDIQECPAADLALVAGLAALLRKVIEELDMEAVAALPTERLASLWNAALVHGAELDLCDHARFLGLATTPPDTLEFWRAVSPDLEPRIDGEHLPQWRAILRRGSLAGAIRARLVAGDDLVGTYRELCRCLAENRLFLAG